MFDNITRTSKSIMSFYHKPCTSISTGTINRAQMGQNLEMNFQNPNSNIPQYEQLAQKKKNNRRERERRAFGKLKKLSPAGERWWVAGAAG
jgi:hypothetical protein